MKLAHHTPLLSKVYEVVPLLSNGTSSLKSILESLSVYSYVGVVPKQLAANTRIYVLLIYPLCLRLNLLAVLWGSIQEKVIVQSNQIQNNTGYVIWKYAFTVVCKHLQSDIFCRYNTKFLKAWLIQREETPFLLTILCCTSYLRTV